jgi:cytidylate kinase
MGINTIITISRQLGSEGSRIGKELSLDFGIPYYDKSLIKKTAKENGYYQDLPPDYDEKPANSLLYSLVMDPRAFIRNFCLSEIPVNQRVFMATIKAIKDLAAEGSCIFVGRCADYALSGIENCCSIFIYAPMKSRIKTICKRWNISPNHAEDIIQKSDQQRASYYSYYTNKKWDDIKNYSLSIDSSLLGIDKTATLIRKFISVYDSVNCTGMHITG